MQQAIRSFPRRSLIQAVAAEPQRFFLFLCVSVTLWLISPCLAARVGSHHGLLAQAKRPMTLVDLVGYSRVLDPQLSQDGSHLLYMLSQSDWKASSRTYHIWRQDVGGGAPVQLTFGESGENTPRWSPNGKM